MSERKTLTSMLIAFIRHPVAGVAIGLIVAVSGAADLFDELEAGRTDLGVHHGMIVYGAYKILAAIADILEGVGSVAERFEK